MDLMPIPASPIEPTQTVPNLEPDRVSYADAKIQEIELGKIAIRTYERGVEAETLACGTGVTAAGLIYATLSDAPSPVCLLARGGDWLEVGFRKSGTGFENVTLKGPADFVFEGFIEVL